mgnify:CR=1 FL=1
MNRVFQNEEKTAFLDSGKFPNLELLEECVKYSSPLLIHKPTVIVFSKVCHQNRNVGFFSDKSIGYRYSRQLMKSQPLGEVLTILLETVNKLLKSDFNGILINEYTDGNDYIGAHSDDESGLSSFGVVSISYGSERIFRIRSKHNKKQVYNEITNNGKIIHMGGNFQKLYTHEIPKQKRIKGTRISFTFRKHIV